MRRRAIEEIEAFLHSSEQVHTPAPNRSSSVTQQRDSDAAVAERAYLVELILDQVTPNWRETVSSASQRHRWDPLREAAARGKAALLRADDVRLILGDHATQLAAARLCPRASEVRRCQRPNPLCAKIARLRGRGQAVSEQTIGPGWQKVSVAAGVIAAVVAVVAYFWPPAQPGNGSTVSTSQASPTPTSAVTPPSTDTSTADAPLPPPPQSAAMASLKVLRMCSCTAPRDQGQIKVQLSITNISSVPLNADIANIRLLFPGDELPGPWTPNEPVAQLSNVTIDGQHFVAIPANANRAWEPEFGTFASHWYAGTLLPGATNVGGRDNADLVFYIPANPDGTVTLGGIALVANDGVTVLGAQPQAEWPPHSEPNTF